MTCGFDIEVKVTGPGGVIAYEMIVIRRALKAAGIRVEVDDDCPLNSRGGEELTEDDWLAAVDNKRKTSVKLIAKHLPWGG